MAIQLILLAAGFSRRFGENKLLAMLQGKPLYLHVLENLVELKNKRKDIASLTVVTRYREIAGEAEKLGVTVAWNNHSEDGISSSLQTGLAAVSIGEKQEQDKQFYCFFVGDQPYMKLKTIEEFLNRFAQSNKGIGCMSREGRTGNPVVFSAKYSDELMALAGDVGGKQVLHKHEEDVFYYEVHEKQQLLDIDRPEHMNCYKKLSSFDKKLLTNDEL